MLNQTEVRLKKIRIIPDSKNTLEFREQCYNKYKDIIPIPLTTLLSYDDEEMTDIFIALQLYYKEDVKKRLNEGAGKGKKDLIHFLNKPLYECLDDKNLNRTQQGLDYLKDYVRHIIYKTRVKGKYPDPTRCLDDVRSFHRALCLCYLLNPGMEVLTISKISTVVQFTGSVLVVSNFRPLSAAVIWNKYAVETNKDKKEINILAPSEGFFGRLLSSYYIAYHNRDKIINYHSFDPNIELKEPSKKLIKDLLKSGGFNKVTNWNPEIHWHGSEVDEARLQEGYFDCIFTSPPYGLHEIYVACGELYLVNSDKDISIKDINEFISTRNQTDDMIIYPTEKVSDFSIGDSYELKGINYKIVHINRQTQSHSQVKTTEAWKELFFRRTVKNMIFNLKLNGYMIWNVANTSTYKNLETDVVQVCQQEGLELIDTLKYELSRRPGSKSKPKFEPVFVFKKTK